MIYKTIKNIKKSPRIGLELLKSKYGQYKLSNDERLNIIKEICKNKDILDIGCIDHTHYLENNNKWLHKNIKSVSKSVTGLDILKDDVKKLNKLGYNIVYSNAECFNLNKKYEVIIAAEIIEHLTNLSGFLISIKKHMNKESKLIITTPNVFSIRRIIGTLLYGTLKENKQHTHYYSDTNIKQLLYRFGFTNINIRYINSNDDNFIRLFIEKTLSLILRKQLKHTLIVESELKCL